MSAVGGVNFLLLKQNVLISNLKRTVEHAVTLNTLVKT